MRTARLASLLALGALGALTGCYRYGYSARYRTQTGYYYRQPAPYVVPGPVYAAPAVYSAPAPVYATPPVYTAPAPVYTAPAPVYAGGQTVYLPAGAIPAGAVQAVVITAQDGRQFTLSAGDLQGLANGQARLNVPPGVSSGTVTVYLNGRPITLPFALQGGAAVPWAAPAPVPAVVAPSPMAL